MPISDEQAGDIIREAAAVFREDIARAKSFILAEAHRESGTMRSRAHGSKRRSVD